MTAVIVCLAMLASTISHIFLENVWITFLVPLSSIVISIILYSRTANSGSIVPALLTSIGYHLIFIAPSGILAILIYSVIPIDHHIADRALFGIMVRSIVIGVPALIIGSIMLSSMKRNWSDR